MSNDRWLRFGNARVEDTRRMIWICFRVSPEVFFADVFGVSWPSFRPTGRTTGRVLPYLEAGMPCYYAEMARRGKQASAQARTAELLAQWRVSQGEPYRRPLGPYYDDDELASTSRPIVPTASCAFRPSTILNEVEMAAETPAPPPRRPFVPTPIPFHVSTSVAPPGLF